jgi:hypothetical protein
MQLVKLIIPKIINVLPRNFSSRTAFLILCFSLLFLNTKTLSAQDNSPYSRYGIGDLVPPTHIINRGMGGINAAYNDYLSINFNNPASYSSFQSIMEQKSKKMVMGRAILDVGVNIESRTLNEPSSGKKFSSNNALFSYVQVGMPLKNNWGLSFGLRPLSRINYNIIQSGPLLNPQTGDTIEKNSSTVYTGDGGAYMVSLGTGFSLFDKIKGENMNQKLSIGFNGYYIFGSKDYSTRRSLLNDTVIYYQANYETKSTIGDFYLDGGIQFKTPLNVSKKISLTVGAFGALRQNLNVRQDVLRETFVYDANLGNVRLDSVSDHRDVPGKMLLPTNYTIGFIIQKPTVINKEGGWLIGADFTKQNWDKYQFYGQKDSIKNSWLLKVGAQLNAVPKRGYFSNVSYRFGLFVGPDYVRVKNKLPQFGGSIGFGLPIAVSRQAQYQVSLINLALEYGKRGNDKNMLKESTFRFSIGFSLSDFWFIKRKYD